MGFNDKSLRKLVAVPYPKVLVCLIFCCLLLYLYSILHESTGTDGVRESTADRVNNAFEEEAYTRNGVADLKKNHLFSPSKEQYNLSNPLDTNPSKGQAQTIASLFHNKRNGFFIECGGLDGETRSNTLYMERQLGWTGIVIEGDPLNFKEMVSKRRKAWISDACLSVHPYPEEVLFKQQKNIGKILAKGEDPNGVSVARVKCFPLYAFTLALEVDVVDYFSLDVEGNEYEVLKTIPFEKLLIKTLSVEFAHDKVSKEEIASFMGTKGYYVHSMVTRSDFLANDFIFVKTGVDL